MKKLMKKKVNMFGKSVPVFVIALLGLTLVSAALLPYFGQITGSAIVSQGLLVDGKTYTDGGITENYDAFTSLEATTTVSGNHNLNNSADVNALVNLDSVCSGGNSCPQVDTRIMGTLTLVEKNISTWEPVSDGLTETISYTIVGEDFIVNDIPSTYTLIYYPDTAGGFPTNVANIKVLNEGANNIENLPIALDVGDNYCENGLNPTATQCVGAKLWLIPGDLGIEDAKSAILNWGTNAPTFLFETELIQYNTEGNIVMSGGVISGGNSLDFTIESDFPLMTYPGTYTITTTVDSQ